MSDIFNLDKIFDTFNYIFWFFLLNLLFILFNLPLVLFFVFIGISNIFVYLPLFLLCSIPIGSSLTALLYCMGKLIRTKDLNILKDFARGIKLNFKQSTFLWCFELILIFILYSNIKFFSTSMYNLLLTCLFASLLIFILLITPYIYLLISRFSMKTIDIIKGSFVLVFTRPLLTIFNMLILLFVLILFEISPGTVVLFFSSITTFLISFANRALLSELETSISK